MEWVCSDTALRVPLACPGESLSAAVVDMRADLRILEAGLEDQVYGEDYCCRSSLADQEHIH